MVQDEHIQTLKGLGLTLLLPHLEKQTQKQFLKLQTWLGKTSTE